MPRGPASITGSVLDFRSRGAAVTRRARPMLSAWGAGGPGAARPFAWPRTPVVGCRRAGAVRKRRRATMSLGLYRFRWHALLWPCWTGVSSSLLWLRLSTKRRAWAASALAWIRRPRCTTPAVGIWALVIVFPGPCRVVVGGTAIWRASRLTVTSGFAGTVPATVWRAMGRLGRAATAALRTACPTATAKLGIGL